MTEEQRDAHLREALRHAPDAQLQPPPALSALILNEARAKARDASAPARAPRHPLAALWDWLARPAVATSFAGVMVATLVGLMWWDQPMDEAMPRRPAPAATAPAPAEAPVAPAPVTSTPAATPPPAAAAEAARPAPPPRPAQRKPAPAADKAVPAAPAPTVRDAPAASAEPAREAAPAPAAPPAAPAVADTATAGAAAPSLAKEKSADESKRLRSMAPNQALGGRAAKAELSESRQRQEADTRTLLASLRASIAAEPARWAWQRGNGKLHDMNDALYAWLAQLDDATGTTWQPRATGGTGTSPSGELRLLRDGRVQHSLRFTERGVWWQREQATWHTELTPAQAHTLQSNLDAAAP